MASLCGYLFFLSFLSLSWLFVVFFLSFSTTYRPWKAVGTWTSRDCLEIFSVYERPVATEAGSYKWEIAEIQAYEKRSPQ